MLARHSAPATAATALAAVLALSACATPPYEAEVAEQLHGQVHAIAASSADGDWAAAVAGLDAMADRLDRAHSRGRLGDDRFEAIAAAMALVRKDLEIAILSAETEAERQDLLDAKGTLEERLRELTEQQQSRSGGDRSGGGAGGPGSGDSGKKDKDAKPGKGGEKGRGAGDGKGRGEGKGRGKE